MWWPKTLRRPFLALLGLVPVARLKRVLTIQVGCISIAVVCRRWLLLVSSRMLFRLLCPTVDPSALQGVPRLILPWWTARAWTGLSIRTWLTI